MRALEARRWGRPEESTACPDPARSIGRPRPPHDGWTQGFHRIGRGLPTESGLVQGREAIRSASLTSLGGDPRKSSLDPALKPERPEPIIPFSRRPGVHAHLDRILRSVKLPAPGGRSDRRDQGCVSRSRVRPDRVEGRRLRNPGRWTAGVLEARDQALPRLPGDPDAAGRLTPARGDPGIRWRTRTPGEPEPARK